MPGENIIVNVFECELVLINQRLEKAKNSPISAIIGNTFITENPRSIFIMTSDNAFHLSELEIKLRNYKGKSDLMKAILRIFQYHFLNLGPAFVVDPNTGERATRYLQMVAEISNTGGNAMAFVKKELFDDAINGITNGSQDFGYSCLAVFVTHFHVDALASMMREV